MFVFPGTLFLSAGTNCLGNDISDGPVLAVSAGKGRGWVRRQMPEFVWDDGVVPRGAGIQRDDAGQNIHART